MFAIFGYGDKRPVRVDHAFCSEGLRLTLKLVRYGVLYKPNVQRPIIVLYYYSNSN